MASTTVRVSRLLSLPPDAFEMPLTSDPKLTVTISPPMAHTGPGPVLARLISYDLREGQVGSRKLLQRQRSPLKPQAHPLRWKKALTDHAPFFTLGQQDAQQPGKV